MYHSAKPHKTCPFSNCDAVFPRTKALNVHIRNVHRENKIKCNHCRKTFQSESGIRKHLFNKHNEEYIKVPELNQHCLTSHGELPTIEPSADVFV